MQLDIKKQPVATCELLHSATAEHPIECDVLLPDYCPDIIRVISCQVTSVCCDASISGKNLLVDAMATVLLCYQGDIGGLRTTEYSVPFSKSFELPLEPMSPMFFVSAEQTYLNCRAVSKRRLDIRGAVIVNAKVYHAPIKQAVSGASGMGVHVKTEDVDGSKLLYQISKSISIREELSIPAGKEFPAQILESSSKCLIKDVDEATGKCIIKGDLMVHILYKTNIETGELQTADYLLPISQVIPLEKVGTETTCMVEVSCINTQCTVDEEGVPDDKILLEVQIPLVLRLSDEFTADIAEDAYSTMYKLAEEVEWVKILEMEEEISTRNQLKAKADAPEGSIKVEDVTAKTRNLGFKHEPKKIVASCQVEFTALIKTAETGYESVTHSEPFSYEIEVDEDEQNSDLIFDITPLSQSAIISNDNVIFDSDLLIKGRVICFSTQKIITNIEVIEENPIIGDADISMIIYYPNEGEKVWDIAKRYHADAEKIIEENSLEDDVIRETKAIIIPT